MSFVVGDELGNIKLLKYNPQLSETNHTRLNLVYPQAQRYDGPPRSVQQIAVKHSGQHDMVHAPRLRHGLFLWYHLQEQITAAFSDGNCCLSQLTENDSLTVLTTWKEDHIKGSKFIGMANRDRQFSLCYFIIRWPLHDSTTFTCTSGGILQKSSLISSEGDNSKSFQIEQSHLDLPSRLYDWRLSEDGLNFAYGGDEVEVSLWNTDRAFQTSNCADQSVSQSNLKRRKKNHDLYPGEIWRARNVSISTCRKFRCSYAIIVAERPPGSETSSSDHHSGLPPIFPSRLSSCNWYAIWWPPEIWYKGWTATRL